MPIQILMPALSPTMTEGTLAKWLKKEGDNVKSGEVIAEIETDKATMEVEAVDEGTIAKILIPAGATGVKVNALIAILLEEGEDSSAVDNVMKDCHQQKPSVSAAAPVDSVISPSMGAQLPSRNPTAFSHASSPTSAAAPFVGAAPSSGARICASPLARRIAEKSGFDLRQIRGTGPRGRIIRVDVEQYVAAGKGQGAFSSHVSGAPSGMPAYRAEPVTGMRKVIAQRLTESKQTIPHFYLSIDIEVDDLLKLREEINQAQADVKVSVNDMLLKATALALIQVPEANASWAQTEIRYYETADISVAVAVEGGLVTPVIRQANLKSLCAVSADMKRLAEAARAGKLMPEEWQGGTFTISNLGMFGIQQFEAIINPPQACILAVGTSERKAVVRADGRIEGATIMRVSLSADHRVVDGVVGAKFLSALRALIQSPLRLVL